VIEAGPITLRRWRRGDVEAMESAIAQSRRHLAPWQGWAATADRASLTAYVERSERAWEAMTDFGYGLFEPTAATTGSASDRGALVGGAGLHARLGPMALEIGYWVHVDRINRGYATAAASALTAAAFALPEVERVEIHCDEANLRSAAVPRKLGYRLDRIETDAIAAPAERGRSMIWVQVRPTHSLPG
jgi:RimJ/RimL family protein N-acetyltransferase